MQAAGGDDIEDVDDMEAVDNVEEADESEKSQVTFLNILLPQLCSVKNVKKIIIKKKNAIFFFTGPTREEALPWMSHMWREVREQKYEETYGRGSWQQEGGALSLVWPSLPEERRQGQAPM